MPNREDPMLWGWWWLSLGCLGLEVLDYVGFERERERERDELNIGI